MRKSVTGVVLVIAAVLLVPVISYAAGLGRMTVRSALGQPLDAEIEIVSLQPGEEDSFTVRLASREAFRQAGVDFSPALASARFSIERQGGKSVIRITTTQPVNDPFLNVLVELQWSNGRLAREYTVLVDPVEYKAAQAAAPAPEPVRAQAVPAAPAQAAPAPAPVAAAVPAPAPAPVQAAAVARTPASAPAPVAAAVPAPAPAAVQAAAVVREPSPAPIQAVPPTQAPTSVQSDTRVSSSATVEPVTTTTATTTIASAPAPVAAASAPPQVVATPAQVPAARTAVAAATATAESYRIRRGDTLGAIARRWKPAEVTLDQMMIALYQGNRHVFIRDNINLIRAGAVLAIPFREQVVAIDAGSAFRQVRSQMTEFARYRRNQDGAIAAAAVRTAPGQREGTGRRVAVRKTGRSL